MTHPYTKLAKELDITTQWLGSGLAATPKDIANVSEAARILRAADAVDVAGLMAMVRRYGDDNWMGNDDTNKLLSEIESALRMALAAERQAAIQHACDVAAEIVLRELDDNGQARAINDAIKEARK